jgi:EAL domain-containing protein (putative c-di-GMP-specific phosphodiesterase class I)/GGDEF domain-containing protein
MQVGVVTLVSNSRFGYEGLWKSTEEMIAALVLAGLVGGFLGSLILQRLRGPLQAVIDQAKAITERRFVSIPEPKVPELRQLAIAMNFTVSRLKAMFEEEAIRLESLRLEANCDALTGLANRESFMTQFDLALENKNSIGGIVMLARIPDLIAINRSLGRYAADDLLRRFGKSLENELSNHNHGAAARLNGADFALLLLDQTNARTAADSLLGAIARATKAYFMDQPAAYIAYAQFEPGMEASTVMMQLDTALALAESAGGDNLREAIFSADDKVPKSTQEWAELLRRALHENWAKLGAFAVSNFAGQLIHHDAPLRLKFDRDGEWIHAGHFLPMAERLHLTREIDLVAVALALAELKNNSQLVGLAVNLSALSIAIPQFRKSLIAQLQQHPGEAKRLWLEVPEAGALTHLDEFHKLCRELKGTHCRVGLEHFGRQFSQIGQFHDIGLDYIKLDVSFIRGINSHSGNQAFLKGVCAIGHNIGVMVIAEGVSTKAEFDALKELGFDGATGPWIKLPDVPEQKT